MVVSSPAARPGQLVPQPRPSQTPAGLSREVGDVVDPWVTVLGVVVTALVAICGWLAARNHTLNQLVATQRDTIDTLKRQVDRMELTAEITDQVLRQLPLPKTRPPGVKR